MGPFGGIDLKVYAYDAKSKINYTEFYIDDRPNPLCTLFNQGEDTVYQCKWNEDISGIRTIKVKAVDFAGNNKTIELDVWILNRKIFG